MLKYGIGAAAAVLAATFAAGAASAQTTYVSFGTGYTQPDSIDTLITNGVSPGNHIDMTFNVDEDFNARVAMGWVLGSFRLEGELGTGNYDVSQYDSRQPAVSRPASGSVGMMSLMANAYYDFGAPGTFSPYLGAGIGAMRTEFEGAGPLPTAPNGPVVTIVDDDDINMAWQLMAGVSVPLASNVSVTGQYRYFDAGTYGLTGFAGHAANVDVKGSSLDVSVRIGF